MNYSWGDIGGRSVCDLILLSVSLCTFAVLNTYPRMYYIVYLIFVDLL